jgi:uncharacterized membrane protein
MCGVLEDFRDGQRIVQSMSDSDSSTQRPRKPWALTFFGFLTAGALVAMPFLAGPPEAGKMPDIVRFLGHFHPVVLHLPIGVFALILSQELCLIFRKRDAAARNTPLFPLFFGAASAIIAVIAGFLLYHGHGDDYGGNELAERHLWGGLAFAVAAVFTFILKAWTLALGSSPAFYRVLLFASVGVMGFASHDGASMTHGSDYLTIYAPAPIREVMGLPVKKEKEAAPATDSTTPVKVSTDPKVYAELVAPILERRCVQCHKESKAKGKFRMDTYELLVKGGKEGSGLEPGKSAESNIIVRIDLPEDDDEHMPPEGKSDIEAPELAVVKWWIDNGADPKKTLSEFIVPDPIKDAISKLKSLSVPIAETKSAAAVKGPDAALKSTVAALSKEFPGALSFESQGSSALVFTAVSLRGNLDDAAFMKLKAILPHLVSVDLSATKITDQTLAQLAPAKNLRLVRLAETNVTDAALASLAKFADLESINLYGTKVTDAGIAKLNELPNLKRLYLWKTAVTPAAIKALTDEIPDCEVITGFEP